MRDEKVMRVCEEWFDTERKLRDSTDLNFIGRTINQAIADRLATCRMELAVAAGIDAEPARSKEGGAE